MKNIIFRYCTIILCVVLFSTSCNKDFLQISPQGSITDALFPTTANDAKSTINAVYANMRNWSYWSGGFPILDIISDDAVKGSSPSDAGRLDLIDNFQFTATFSDIDPWYSALYKAVKAANVVIEKVPAIEMDANLKTRYIAEASFLRAMFYFNLVRAFGDVPKVTTINPPLKLLRSPKQEIYNEIIIPDLKLAIDNLPEKKTYSADDLGRASKGAAKSLLAKVYLYLNDFENAEKYVLEVITSNVYSLEPVYTDAFSLAGQWGVESVFEVGARPFDGDFILGGNQYANTQGVRGDPNKGWGFNRPSVNLINFFAPEDVRKKGTIIFLGDVIDGITITGDISTPDFTYVDEAHTIIKEQETYNRKVWVPGTGTTSEYGYNVRVLRYAEILLIAAEVLNENNKSSEALIYLNLVRKRAGFMTDITDSNKASLRIKIWDERRAELAMEGDRFFDLVRTGQAEAVLGPLGFKKGKHELFPIPQNEIDLSEGTLTQNPGW